MATRTSDGGAVSHEIASEFTDTQPRADECQAQLDRILSSPDFDATEREHRFLIYIIQETLAGRGKRIKAYSIAIEVFGREASFDAQNDPIVRIAAGQLRRALERYYLTAGRGDPLKIDIPKGSYVPQFSSSKSVVMEGFMAPTTAAHLLSTPSNTASAIFGRGLIGGLGAAVLAIFTVLASLSWMDKPAVPTSPEIPRIQVVRFEDLTQSNSSAIVASGLTQEIVTHLSKFKDIVVLQMTNAAESPSPPPRFILTGSVEASDETFHLRIRLLNQEDESVLWANRFDGALKASELVAVQSAIAEKVATSLAQTYGVIFQADALRASRDDPPDDWAAYSCTLSYYAYRMSMDRSAQPKVRRCLELSVERFPNYSTAWALLSQMQFEQIRFRIPLDLDNAGPAIEEALANARRANQLDPQNTRALQAEMFGLFLTKQYEAGKRVGEQALELNPNDTEFLGEYGIRLALSGDWTRGCALLASARDLNPGAKGYYESCLILCSLFSRDSTDAITWVRKRTVANNAMSHLIAAAVFGNAGLREEGRKEVAWLCSNRPELVKAAHSEVTARLGNKKDAEFFMDSLRKAGLPDASASNHCSEEISP